MQANDGNLSGSVKPLVRDLEVLDLNKDSDNPLNLAWQSVVATVAEIFTNHRHDQIGIEVPFEGKFDSPETDAWSAVLSMFSNAFIRALKPGLDGELEFKRRNEKLKD